MSKRCSHTALKGLSRPSFGIYQVYYKLGYACFLLVWYALYVFSNSYSFVSLCIIISFILAQAVLNHNLWCILEIGVVLHCDSEITLSLLLCVFLYLFSFLIHFYSRIVSLFHYSRKKTNVTTTVFEWAHN